MEKKFSKHWKSSKQPRKQRKYLANAPFHIKNKFLSANLSRELRKKYGKRNLSLRKNDIVKIMRGKFKGKTGKVLLVNVKKQRVEVENIQRKKQDGSKINVPIKSSNLKITELYLEDRKRLRKLEGQRPSEEKKNEKNVNKGKTEGKDKNSSKNKKNTTKGKSNAPKKK